MRDVCAQQQLSRHASDCAQQLRGDWSACLCLGQERRCKAQRCNRGCEVCTLGYGGSWPDTARQQEQCTGTDAHHAAQGLAADRIQPNSKSVACACHSHRACSLG
jgi:hypothetical protein